SAAIAGIEQVPERVGGDDATGRHRDAGALQLAQARALAADARPVVDADLVEVPNPAPIVHRSSLPASVEHAHDAAVAVDADALAAADALGRGAGADHSGQAVFARD